MVNDFPKKMLNYLTQIGYYLSHSGFLLENH